MWMPGQLGDESDARLQALMILGHAHERVVAEMEADEGRRYLRLMKASLKLQHAARVVMDYEIVAYATLMRKWSDKEWKSETKHMGKQITWSGDQQLTEGNKENEQ